MDTPGTTRTTTWLLGLILLAHLLLAGMYSLSVPLGEAPDEADHWAYIQYLARERHLPRGPELTQAKHPPLYHASAALIAMAAVPNVGTLDSRLFLRSNPDVSFRAEDVNTGAYGYNSFIHTTYEAWPWRPGPLAFHLARFWSVLLSTLTVWGTFHLVRRTFPREEHRPLALIAAAFVAFLPEFAFIGSVLNNDTLAACLATLALWGGMSIFREERLRAGWWTPLALGLGVWAKVSTLAIWPTVILLGGTRRFRVRNYLALTLPALLLSGPWFLRNQLLYGDPLGMALVRATVDQRTGPWTWEDTRWLLSGWFHSFWGKFGSAGHIPLPREVYFLLGLLTLVGLAGWGMAFLRFRQQRWEMAALTLVPVSVALAIWRYSLVALGTDQGRLLFPALAAVAGLMAVGWLIWVPSRWWRPATWGLIIGMAVLGVFGWAGVIRPAYAPPPPATVPADLRLSQPVHFGPLALVGWNPGRGPTLYWQSTAPIEDDLRVVIRFVGEDDRLVWEWKRSPGAGRWSTDHWPVGYIMEDRYPSQRWQHIPAGRYRVEVGVYTFMGSHVIPQGHREPFVTLGYVEKQ